MAIVWVPSLLRDLTGGQTKVEVPGTSVRQVIDGLEALYPGVRARLCEGDSLSSLVAVAVDGELSNLRLLQTVRENSEIHFVPAISGG